jgi:hypothetical protein
MAIKLKNGKPASHGAIEHFEKLLGCKLSDSFLSFIRSHDGAVPEANTFKIGDKNGSGVRQFIPIIEIEKERSYIENISSMAYPIATDDSGNFILIDESRGGAVYFWDHEMPLEMIQLASNFSEFLDSLAPFDINTVQLKPGQVKRVWIDPEFLKKLKSGE